MNGSAKYIIRHLQGSENHLLREFLYEAIYIPEGVKPPSKDVVDLPELKLYIEDFGKKKDDFCLVADCEGLSLIHISEPTRLLSTSERKKMTFVWSQTVKGKWSVQYGYVL